MLFYIKLTDGGYMFLFLTDPFVIFMIVSLQLIFALLAILLSFATGRKLTLGHIVKCVLIGGYVIADMIV